MPLPGAAQPTTVLQGTVGQSVVRGTDGANAYLHLRNRSGQPITLSWVKQSESVGRPNDGQLENGVAFPPQGPGWWRKSGNEFGTDETIRLLEWAFRDVAYRFTGTAPVVLGDLSGEDGGRLKHHKSHQSGRDVDIGYFALGNGRLRGFVKMDDHNLDTEKSWALVENFLRSGYVQYIFMSYRVQELLYEEALAQGWAPEDLEKIFQYPRGPKKRKGMIRHAKGHQDHFHIRFKCPAADKACHP